MQIQAGTLHSLQLLQLQVLLQALDWLPIMTIVKIAFGLMVVLEVILVTHQAELQLRWLWDCLHRHYQQETSQQVWTSLYRLKMISVGIYNGGLVGAFVSPYYTDPISLSLPYHQMPNMANPTMYVVNHPITVTAGQVASQFGQYGGVTQYILPQTIQKLMDSEILSKL